MRRDFENYETFAVSGELMNEITSQLDVAHSLSCSGGQFLIEELQHKLMSVLTVREHNEKQEDERRLDSPT